MTNEADRRELSSWKEIAAYLDVTERTAQNWERERNLPVRRHPGGRGRVFAYRDEVDSWKNSAEAATVGQPEPPDLPKPPHTARWQRWAVVGGPALLVLLVAGSFWLRTPSPAYCRIENETLIALDNQGRDLWRKAAPGHQQSVHASTQVIDLDGDGVPEVLFAYRGYPEQYLLCLDARGQERWRYRPGRAVSVADRTFANTFHLHTVIAARMGREGKVRIVVTAPHHPSSPAQVALLDDHGKVLREYWHPGHLNFAAIGDLDKDGLSEIYLAGINNIEDAATLVVLDPDTFSGSAVDNGGNPIFLGMRASPEIRRLVLPRTDLNRECCKYNAPSGLLLHPGDSAPIELFMNEDPNQSNPEPAVIYTLNRELKIRDVTYSDYFVTAHRKLEMAGVLKPLR